MKSFDLKEAQGVVDSIALIDISLSRELYTSRANQLSVKDSYGSETYLAISSDVAEAALEMQKVKLRARRAALVRRAAQIGLIL